MLTFTCSEAEPVSYGEDVCQSTTVMSHKGLPILSQLKCHPSSPTALPVSLLCFIIFFQGIDHQMTFHIFTYFLYYLASSTMSAMKPEVSSFLFIALSLTL